MIVRILGEGQYEVAPERLPDLNEIDRAVEAAIEARDETSFRDALVRLVGEVREGGTPLADDVFVESDLVLPGPEATLDEVAAMLDEEGLLPG
jgi:PspA-Associated protein